MIDNKLIEARSETVLDEHLLISNKFLLQLDRIFLERGGPLLSVMSEAGLPYEALVLDGLMLPFDRHMKMLELSEKELNIKPIGLVLARRQLVSHLQPLFDRLLDHAVIRDSIRVLSETIGLVVQGLKISLQEENDLAYIQISTNHPYLRNSPIFQDHSIGLLAQYLRWIAGKKFRLQSVSFPHAEPQDLLRFRSFFGCPLSFGDGCLSISFTGSFLNQDIIGKRQPLKREYNDVLDWDRAASLQAQLRSAIRDDLGSSTGTLENVATSMKLSSRTLQRRLSSKGTSFSNQLDSVRAGVARRLIYREDIELNDIAAELGYSDQAGFTRAFKRWYQRTPSDWRSMISSYKSLNDSTYGTK